MVKAARRAPNERVQRRVSRALPTVGGRSRQGFGSARSDQTHISAGRSAAVQRRQSDHSAAVSLHHLQWYRDGCAGIEPAEPYPRRWHWRCQEGTLALPAVQRSLAALAAAQPVLRS